MARSPSVWMVIDRSTRTPVAAFTVKNELCIWLRKYQSDESIDRLSGWKIVDGWKHWVSGEAAGPWPLDLRELRGPATHNPLYGAQRHAEALSPISGVEIYEEERKRYGGK